jgi:uncharacterized protein DUF885
MAWHPLAQDASEFDRLEREVVEHLFRLQPGLPVFLGFHEYDGQVPDLSAPATDRWVAGADQLLARLRAAPPAGDADSHGVDRRLLELLLESPKFDLAETHDLERNPMSYPGSISLTSYMTRPYAPVGTRTAAIVATLQAVPGLLDTGRRRLGPVLPKPFVTLAMAIAGGLPSHFGDAEAFARRESASLGEAVRTAREPAERAVGEFLGRLRSEWLPKATEEFALGPDRYQRLLWVREGLRTPFDEIRREGEADLARNQARLEEVCGGASRVASSLEEVYRDHPDAAHLIPTAQTLVGEAKEFVRANDLATIPEPATCHVEETPSYGRALSTASMNSPGAFETDDEGIYYVTPVDAAWTPARQEEWLRSLNRPMLRNISVHEVYPGHYLQFLHLRRSKNSMTRKVFRSSSFTEGWAHYCEQLVIEHGLGGTDRRAEVAQLHDALLRNCRLVASVGLHTRGETLEWATRLFMEKAHMERLPAEREAIRGTFDPEYYCYTLGKLRILAARKRLLSGTFGGSEKAFHDRLLSTGAPPIGLIEELLARPAAS